MDKPRQFHPAAKLLFPLFTLIIFLSLMLQGAACAALAMAQRAVRPAPTYRLDEFRLEPVSQRLTEGGEKPGAVTLSCRFDAGFHVSGCSAAVSPNAAQFARQVVNEF